MRNVTRYRIRAPRGKEYVSVRKGVATIYINVYNVFTWGDGVLGDYEAIYFGSKMTVYIYGSPAHPTGYSIEVLRKPGDRATVLFRILTEVMRMWYVKEGFDDN